MEVEHSLSHSQGLGSVHRQLGRTQVPVKRDDGLVLERFLLGSDLQRSSVRDQDVLRLKFYVLLIKHQLSAYHRRSGVRGQEVRRSGDEQGLDILFGKGC